MNTPAENRAAMDRTLCRFEKKYQPVTESGCWIWTGATIKSGYGTVTAWGRGLRAHRLAWMLYRGEDPGQMHVLHRCDTRCCVNPDHLFLGTNADNIADKVAKGRQGVSHGVGHVRARLTEQQVLDIFHGPDSLEITGRQYGISHSTVGRIRNREIWKRLTANETHARTIR